MGGGEVGGGGEAFRVICEMGIGGAGAGIEVELQVVLVVSGRDVGDKSLPELVLVGVAMKGKGVGGPASGRGGSEEEPAPSLVHEAVGVDSIGVVEFFETGINGHGVGKGDRGGRAHRGVDQGLIMSGPMPGEGRGEGIGISGGEHLGQIQPTAGDALTSQRWQLIHRICAPKKSNSLRQGLRGKFREPQSYGGADDWCRVGSSRPRSIVRVAPMARRINGIGWGHQIHRDLAVIGRRPKGVGLVRRGLGGRCATHRDDAIICVGSRIERCLIGISAVVARGSHKNYASLFQP